MDKKEEAGRMAAWNLEMRLLLRIQKYMER
jgi:hypothetical protein